MNIEWITPFVRFSGDLTVTDGRKDMCSYDMRFYFCVNGSGTVTVDGEVYSMNANTFLMWRPGNVYTYTSEDTMQCITCNFDYTNRSRHLTIPVPPDHISEYKSDAVIGRPVIFDDHAAFNGVVYLPDAPNLLNLIVSLRDEYNKKLKYYRIKTNALLSEILLEVLRLGSNEFYGKTDGLMNEILNFIQDNFKENLTNEQISNRFGYHPNYINALIVKHTGLSLHQYLLNCKMSKAMELLMSSGLGIKEISDLVGIEDPRYFSRLFKKWYKKPPSAFRNRM